MSVCGAGYARQACGRPSHFCIPCRRINTAKRRTAWRRSGKTAKNVALPGAAKPEVGTGSTVMDRMLRNANSPIGPDEGRTTKRGSAMRLWLDKQSEVAAADPWFAANPHWAAGWHDDRALTDYPNLTAN
jgi:hypothetical protein